MFFHVSITTDEDENEKEKVLFTTRKEHGGSGEPCLYILESGGARPLRGIEIALHSMAKGERSIIVMKPELCFLHGDVDKSCMAKHLMDSSIINPKRDYTADVELLDWIATETYSFPCSKNHFTFKRVTKEGIGWETPREPFTVTVKISGKLVGYNTNVERDMVYSETILTCEIGDGTLPKDLEAGICSMRKEEQASIFCPVTSSHAMFEKGAVMFNLDPTKSIQYSYVEFEVKLLDMLQARDLMGDGKTIKGIIRMGEGEFPIDCPMEDTLVSIVASSRRKGESEWSDIRNTDGDGSIQVHTGMGELPDILDAAVRLMLANEVSILSTTVDKRLQPFIDAKYTEGTQIEIKVELKHFEPSVPLEGLDPKSKLERGKQLKQQGNKLYKENRISLAQSKYKKALVCVGRLFEFEDEDLQMANEIKVSSMLNLAACAQQESEYGEAVKWCEKVMDEYPENSKAYFRRSKAKQSMALFEEALEDLNTMLELDPSLKDEVLREKRVLVKKAKEASERQKKMWFSSLTNKVQ